MCRYIEYRVKHMEKRMRKKLETHIGMDEDDLVREVFDPNLAF